MASLSSLYNKAQNIMPLMIIESYLIWSIEISFAVWPWEIFDRIQHFALKENLEK